MSKEKNTRRFVVTVAGPRVGPGRLSAKDLVEIMRRTQQLLSRVGQIVDGSSSSGRRRKRRDIEQLCELFLVDWAEGSAVATFEVPPPEQGVMFGDIGERSLDALIEKFEIVASSSQPEGEDGDQRAVEAVTATLTGFNAEDIGILETMDTLGQVFEHGIESIRFSRARDGRERSFAFTPAVRERVRGLLNKPSDERMLSAAGRLEELNGHEGLSGRLWDAAGRRWTCRFRKEHIEQLPDAWLRTVRVTGRGLEEPGVGSVIEVQAIEILDDLSVPPDQTGGTAFWHSATIEELIDRQQVSPVSDLDEIGSLWPEDDDPDAFLQFVVRERGERYRAGDR